MAQLTITIDDAALTAFVDAQCSLFAVAFAQSGLARGAFAKKMLIEHMANQVISARDLARRKADETARAAAKTDWLSKAT